MTETALAAERDAYDVRVLTEVMESGLRLLQAQETYAAARMAVVTAQGAALNPGEDSTAACGKIAPDHPPHRGPEETAGRRGSAEIDSSPASTAATNLIRSSTGHVSIQLIASTSSPAIELSPILSPIWPVRTRVLPEGQGRDVSPFYPSTRFRNRSPRLRPAASMLWPRPADTWVSTAKPCRNSASRVR